MLLLVAHPRPRQPCGQLSTHKFLVTGFAALFESSLPFEASLPPQSLFQTSDRLSHSLPLGNGVSGRPETHHQSIAGGGRLLHALLGQFNLGVRTSV